MYNVAGRPKTINRWFKADLFKSLREAEGYDSQSALASVIGIDQRQISNWETNKHDPSADQLVIISRFFKISIDYLLGQSNDPQIHQLEDNIPLKDRLAEFVTQENATELLQYIASILESKD